ncbi:MAG: 1-deoxy-D-xylulose-5-phosphate reductoisomerase [bacterium]
MKHLSVLGSTGSVGVQTLEVIKKYHSYFKIVGLTANSNVALLKKQITQFKPKAVALMDKKAASQLQKVVKIKVYSGLEGIIKIACLKETDTVVNSVVGSIGVEPTYAAIKAKKNVALANKETLVTAGEVIMKEVKKNKIILMPIDSEHSAIFQCLNGEGIKKVRRIIITASGGPFKNHTLKQMEKVTLKNALKHPTWTMGAKITIDSATLMNKGFEVIEAHFLYDVPYEKIDVVVHPQSIVHSLVEFDDRSVMAQLGNPNMKIPIQYALSYPERLPTDIKVLNLADIAALTFFKPNYDLFPCLKYAFYAGKIGGTLPAVVNAANEIAVSYFLQDKIKYLDIPKTINKMMKKHKVIKNPTLKQILKVDKETKEETEKDIKSLISKF